MGTLLVAFLQLATLAFIARALLSWFPIGRDSAIYPVARSLESITEPVLAPRSTSAATNRPTRSFADRRCRGHQLCLDADRGQPLDRMSSRPTGPSSVGGSPLRLLDSAARVSA